VRQQEQQLSASVQASPHNGDRGENKSAIDRNKFCCGPLHRSFFTHAALRVCRRSRDSLCLRATTLSERASVPAQWRQRREQEEKNQTETIAGKITNSSLSMRQGTVQTYETFKLAWALWLQHLERSRQAHHHDLASLVGRADCSS
jgi:hypothetical protein